MNKHRKKYVESHREILRHRIEQAINDYVNCTHDRIAKVEPYYLRSKCAEMDGEVNLLGVEIEYILNLEKEGDE